jgi:hypothetical protein
MVLGAAACGAMLGTVEYAQLECRNGYQVNGICLGLRNEMARGLGSFGRGDGGIEQHLEQTPDKGQRISPATPAEMSPNAHSPDPGRQGPSGELRSAPQDDVSAQPRSGSAEAERDEKNSRP